MKQINRLIVALVIVMAAMACLAAAVISKEATRKDNSYLVGINRIEERLCRGETLQQVQAEAKNGKYLGITKLSYLEERQNGKRREEFFAGAGVEKGACYVVRMFPGGERETYLRYEYVEKTAAKATPVVLVECLLAAVTVLVLAVLLYVKHAVLKPFCRLQEMPYELAKGNYEYDMKETRYRYFGRFLWGLDRLKEELRGAKEKQLMLEKEKKMMILTVSHDVKTPLSAIALYTEALKEGLYVGEEKRQQIYRLILEKVENIEDFMGQIEKMSTTGLLQITVNRQEHYLKELIEPLEQTYKEKFALHKTDFEIGPYEDKLVFADVDRVQEVFANLFENAMKYGDGRWVRVSFYEEDYCQLIKVASSGGKIKKSQFPHLFQSFFRGENAAGKKGSGLGLYICKEIMTKLGGDIFVEEEEDGMSFVLVFPMY